MQSFHAYFERSDGPHVRVRIFAGPDSEHRSLAGILTFREDEFNDFRNLWLSRYDMSPVETENPHKP